MLATMALTVFMNTNIVQRLNSEDIYCAAIGIVLTEEIQAHPSVGSRSESDMLTMTVYFLGRVEGATPDGDAAESVLDMAQVLTRSTLSEEDISSCGEFMASQVGKMIEGAQRRHRPLR